MLVWMYQGSAAQTVRKMLHDGHEDDELRRRSSTPAITGDRRVQPVVRAAADEEELERQQPRPGWRTSASRSTSDDHFSADAPA
jgi:hypothetical protein